MTSRLDELLKTMNPPAPSAGALERALLAARQELAQKRPVRRWRTELGWSLAAVWGLSAVAVAVVLAAGLGSAALLGARTPGLLVLGATAALCLVAALAPRAGLRLRVLSAAGAGVSAALLVLARAPAVGPAAFPEWVCTASHLAAGVLPLGVALFALRHTAPNALRSTLVGLGAGTLGACIGELVCQQGPRHVATYHLGAWATVALLAVFVSRILPRRAYAP